MGRLWLVRHGESEGNAAGVVQGQLDYPLTPVGRAQAAAVAARLASIDAARLVASPLARAWDTAEVVAEATGLTAVADSQLMEYDYGERAGLTLSEAQERHPSVFAGAAGMRPVFPGEEGRENFHRRVALTLEGDSVVVTHGGVIGAVGYLVAGVDAARSRVFRPRNCALTIVSTGDDGVRVIEAFNDACHLASAPGDDLADVF